VAQEHKVDPPAGAAPREAEEDDRKVPIRLILLGLLGLYLLLFIILNSGSVSVSFVFFSAKISLIVGLVLAIVLGFVSGYIANELRDRRKRRAAQPTKA
jgi:uncharacterized integral membrane protein